MPIADGEALADVVLRVQLSTRVERVRAARDHLRGQGDVGRDHQVSALHLLHDPVVGHVEALRYPDARTFARSAARNRMVTFALSEAEYQQAILALAGGLAYAYLQPMGTFNVTIDIGDPSGQHFEPIEALVDTGATYTVVPALILERLRVPRHARDRFVLADGRGVDLDLGHTWVRINGRTVITLVVFGDPDSRTLLGAYTLEGVRLAPDPVGRRLVPVSALLVTCAGRQVPESAENPSPAH